MFPDLTKFLPMLQIGLDDLKHLLGHIYNEIKANKLAAEKQASLMESDIKQRQPSSSLPLVLEASITAETRLDVAGLRGGAAPNRGYYANIGDAPLKVVLVGVNGATTAAHTLPPQTTISLPCQVAALIVSPAEAEPVTYQVYVY